MKTFIYPGSFDPPTCGHADIARCAAALCDKLIVAVLGNVNKPGAMFTVPERVKMLEEVFQDVPNIEVRHFDGLLVDACHAWDATCIVRGVRGMDDMANEMQLAAINRRIGDVQTIFLPADESLMYVSSSVVRELVHYKSDISSFVPETVRNAIDKGWYK